MQAAPKSKVSTRDYNTVSINVVAHKTRLDKLAEHLGAERNPVELEKFRGEYAEVLAQLEVLEKELAGLPKPTEEALKVETGRVFAGAGFASASSESPSASEAERQRQAVIDYRSSLETMSLSELNNEILKHKQNAARFSATPSGYSDWFHPAAKQKHLDLLKHCQDVRRARFPEAGPEPEMPTLGALTAAKADSPVVAVLKGIGNSVSNVATALFDYATSPSAAKKQKDEIAELEKNIVSLQNAIATTGEGYQGVAVKADYKDSLEAAQRRLTELKKPSAESSASPR